MTRKPRPSIVAAFGALSQQTPAPAAVTATPRVAAGVIGATQRTLADIRAERDELRARVEAGGGTIELDPAMIDPSPFPDRLPDDEPAGFEAFARQFAEEGQKVPIEVRRHPAAEGRYQIVYGHRRWRAAARAGLPVRAIVVALDDRELAIAQGIENSARQDLSWIEKALFATRMQDAGVKARDIRAALGVDDAELTRFRAVRRALPVGVIEAIGRAPRVGRPRWMAFVAAFGEQAAAGGLVRDALAGAKALPSDERFGRAAAALAAPASAAGRDRSLVSMTGEPLGTLRVRGRNLRLSLSGDRADAFARFLEEEMPRLADRFLARSRSS